MTATGRPAHRRRASRGAPPELAAVTVREPGELLTAVAAQLGFHPRDSLVLVGTIANRIELVLRADLPPPADTPLVCRAAADGLTTASPTGAVVLVVGGGPAPAGGDEPPRSDVAGAATAALAGFDVDVRTTLWAGGTTAGSPWACYPPCDCGGRVPDPATTAVGAAAVVSGRVVRSGREELHEVVTPPDPGLVRRRSALFDRRPVTAVGGLAEAAGHRAALESALAAAATGRLDLDDATVLALAMALHCPEVRDHALLSCVGPRAHAAEQLWAALTRATPDPEAAEPAALLAVSALARGDGALANVAVERALDAWPGHRFATTLAAALASGFGPEQVRHWLTDAAVDLVR